MRSRNFSSKGHRQCVKSPPALFSNCLQQMFIEEEVCLLQTYILFYEDAVLPSDGLKQFCGRCFFSVPVFTLLKTYLHFSFYFFAAHMALFFLFEIFLTSVDCYISLQPTWNLFCFRLFSPLDKKNSRDQLAFLYLVTVLFIAKVAVFNLEVKMKLFRST